MNTHTAVATQVVDLPPLLSMKDVCRLTTLSRTAINKARNAGRFPTPVNLDGNRLAFVTSEVTAWIASRVEARGGLQ